MQAGLIVHILKCVKVKRSDVFIMIINSEVLVLYIDKVIEASFWIQTRNAPSNNQHKESYVCSKSSMQSVSNGVQMILEFKVQDLTPIFFPYYPHLTPLLLTQTHMLQWMYFLI